MLKYFYFCNIKIPSYSLIVILGIVICIYIAMNIAKRKSYSYMDLFWLWMASGVCAVIGAKVLTLITDSMKEGTFLLSWNFFINAGYSYYGGLFGFLASSRCICKRMKIDVREYAKDFLFLLPLLHFFWKIGCFMGGCCIGIPYNGIGAIVFPKGTNALAGLSIFPTQLLESFLALLIAIVMLVLRKAGKLKNSVGFFLITYGSTRFLTEFLRYHVNSSFISDGHIWSAVCVFIGIILMYKKDKVVEE